MAVERRSIKAEIVDGLLAIPGEKERYKRDRYERNLNVVVEGLSLHYTIDIVGGVTLRSHHVRGSGIIDRDILKSAGWSEQANTLDVSIRPTMNSHPDDDYDYWTCHIGFIPKIADLNMPESWFVEIYTPNEDIECMASGLRMGEIKKLRITINPNMWVLEKEQMFRDRNNFYLVPSTERESDSPETACGTVKSIYWDIGLAPPGS